MHSLVIVLLAVSALLFLASTALLVLLLKERKKAARLAESVEAFMENGSGIAYSMAEDAFAQLQNQVSDLSNMLVLERSRSQTESKKNSEFIADISHQLKTPLAGLRLYCEMDAAAAPTAHTDKELQLIEKMEKFIYDLLRLEKIKSDAYVMDFQTQDMRDLVEESIDGFRHLFPQAVYSVTGGGCLRCDRMWMLEAVSNVIKNASEHTERGGHIAVQIESSDRSLTVFIQDDGGGVPEAELGKLFIRFHKADDAKPGSAGIGLAITKAIVEKHHGTAAVENRQKGLCVILCFPRIDGKITV